MNYKEEIPELIDFHGEPTKEVRNFNLKKEEEYRKIWERDLKEFQMEQQKEFIKYKETERIKKEKEYKEQFEKENKLLQLKNKEDIEIQKKNLEKQMLFGLGAFFLFIIILIIKG